MQKRTGYVFAPRDVLPIIAFSAKVLFLVKFGAAMNGDANGYIKAGNSDISSWLNCIVEANLIDEEVANLLRSNRGSLLSIEIRDLKIPKKWATERPELAATLTNDLRNGLKGGLVYKDLKSFRKVMQAMFGFVDKWYEGNLIVSGVENEAKLQDLLCSHFRSRKIRVIEGSSVGGGRLDLYVDNSIVVELKFVGSKTAEPTSASPYAGAQGRRYAIALQSQIVLSVTAVRIAKGGNPPQRCDMIEIRRSATHDGNRTEIRFTLPFGADLPSRQTPEK